MERSAAELRATLSGAQPEGKWPAVTALPVPDSAAEGP